MLYKKFLIASLIISLLASCSPSSKAPKIEIEKESIDLNSSYNYSVPSNCDKTYLFNKLKEQNPNTFYEEKLIDPDPGSDIYTAYNAGGLTCTYTVSSQEITITWAPFYETLFSPLLLNWVESGMSEMVLPGLEGKNYLLFFGKNTNTAQMVKKVISHTEEQWIALQLKTPANISIVEQLINHAFASFLTKEEASINSLLNTCYKNESSSATAYQIEYININYHENTTFTADLIFNKNYPISKTLLIGNYENNILHGIFTSKAQGEIIEQELYLYGNTSGFKESSTPLNPKNNFNQLLYPRPLDLKYNFNNNFIPTTCAQK